MRTGSAALRVGRSIARAAPLAAAAVLLATSFAGAAEVVAELDATATHVTVERGRTASFTLRVKATGSIKCDATKTSPAKATFDGFHEITMAGGTSSHSPAAPALFYAGLPNGTPNNCQVTWDGDPAWIKVPMQVRADANAPLKDYTVRLRPVLETPLGSGDRLADATPTFLHFTVVEGSDTAPPVVDCSGPNGPKGDGDWYLGAVWFDCTAGDAGSGLADPDDASFVLATSGEGSVWTGARTVSDAAGNETVVAAKGPFDVDPSDPLVTIASPVEGAEVLLGSEAPAWYVCEDAVSGIASCAGEVPDGGDLDTSAVGERTFTVLATDAAGRTAQVSVTYRVVYPFAALTMATGSGDPKAGSAIPLSWTLGAAAGASAYSWAGSGPCGAGPASATPLNVNGNGLTVDADGTFRLVWKSEKAWAGTCRTLYLAFDDGATHGADVWFR